MSNRILFVDDEQNVLRGLRRTMRSARRDWEYDFAEGGEQALERMAKQPFDALITDMRMPGMDGAALIAETAVRYPETIRMVLSGQCDEEAACRLVGPSHQFYSKPCENDLLVETLDRALSLRDRLANTELPRVIGRLTALPSPPEIYDRLVDVIASSTSANREIGAIVASDMGLTAKILQLANSGYFAARASIVDPQQAVQVLGVEPLRTLIADYDLIWRYGPEQPNAAAVERIWRRSIACSGLAKAIASEAGLDAATVETAAVAGLLHDCGGLVLTVHDLPADGSATVGAYLTALWGLPSDIVEAIEHQHDLEWSATQEIGPTAALKIAITLLDEAEKTGGAGLVDSLLPASPDQLSRWRELAPNNLSEGGKP